MSVNTGDINFPEKQLDPDYKLNRARDTLRICRARMDAVQEQVEAGDIKAALTISLATISDLRDVVEDVLDVRQEV